MVSLDQVIIFLFVMQIWIGRWHTNHVDFRSRSRSLARNLSLNFLFSSRRRHTRGLSDWSSDVCTSDLLENIGIATLAMASRVDDALAEAGAQHLVGRRIRSLSGGERQRVALAAVLAMQPRLVVLEDRKSGV